MEYLRSILPSDVEPEFYVYLQNLTPKDIKIHALHEGTIVFPRLGLFSGLGPSAEFVKTKEPNFYLL